MTPIGKKTEPAHGLGFFAGREYNIGMIFSFSRNSIRRVRHRILVTGSRGKSSLARLIFTGLAASGLEARGRITGVLPRELAPDGERLIVRNSPAHVEEMRWWLRQMPPGVEAIVMENSAVQPELQHLAARWLAPTLTVMTNARPDHEDAWGPGPYSALDALMRGVSDEGIFLAGGEPGESKVFLEKISQRRGESVVMEKKCGNWRESNLALAIRALDLLGLSNVLSFDAMKNLGPDVADFRIFKLNDESEKTPVLLASAFSANDPQSAAELFDSTGWREDETCILYADRPDRRARLESFRPFLSRSWRDVQIVPTDQNSETVKKLFRDMQTSEKPVKIFGCGNVKGFPLELLKKFEREGREWRLP